LKGLIIHIGEYLRPSIIDTRRPHEYKIKYAMFNENGKVSQKGDLHVDPEFETFTYGDFPQKGAKANLGKLTRGNYIFFNCTFLEMTGEKARYIVGYFRLKDIRTVEEILKKSLANTKPYCNNEHVRYARDGKWSVDGSIFIGDPEESKKLRVPLRFDKEMVKKLNLMDSWERPISHQFGRKKNTFGRLMHDIEIINVYTRNPKILDEMQVEILLEEIRKVGN